MGTRYEGRFTGYDGSELFYQTWEVPQPKGLFLITHGISEHSECYDPLAQELNYNQWNVAGWDLRGHGQSQGKRGYVSSFEEFEKDLRIFIDYITKKSSKDLPLILFGHSMGGLITTKTLMKNGSMGAKALCLSAPAFGLALPVPLWKIQAAKLSRRFWPQITMYNEVNYDALSRDETVLKSYPADPLRHDRISPNLFFGLLEGFEFIQNHTSEVQVPTLLQAGEKDNVVNLSSIEEFYEKIPAETKKLIIYDDSLHEIFNDLDRKLAIKDLKSFINPYAKKIKNKDTNANL